MSDFLEEPVFKADHKSTSVPSPSTTEEWEIDHFDYVLMIPYAVVNDKGTKHVQELAAKRTLDQLFLDLANKPEFFDVQMQHDINTGQLRIGTRIKMMRKVK